MGDKNRTGDDSFEVKHTLHLKSNKQDKSVGSCTSSIKTIIKSGLCEQCDRYCDDIQVRNGGKETCDSCNKCIEWVTKNHKK